MRNSLLFRGLPQYRISLDVFDVDTVAKVAVSQGKSEWSFLLGPAPFCVASLSLFCGETQIWLGDLRVALVFGLVFVVCFCFGSMMICLYNGPYVSLYSQFFTAYAIVRTEP